ncbi:Dityrosine transporter 1 [Cyberlindnera fabianii]|uniref:Dityrosine transporter 1 n=1 Tax=Cyberlindnera fabianii TaxID=36022 RepID=A0A1V2L4H5_CYBFA|nr:Dityrosine transporter 1 [Cyberlindnera fabianii]
MTSAASQSSTTVNSSVTEKRDSIIKQTDIEKVAESPITSGTTPSTPPPYTAFSNARISCIIAIVTCAGFLGPVSGNIYIPILQQMQEVFNCSTTTINATVSVFMVFFAIAPLLWAPYADIGGRKTLYIVSLLFFIIANILLATVPANIGALFVLRIVQAFGASSVMSVGTATVADVTPPKDRAKVISYFMLGPQLGPILGPILSIIAWNGAWRWIFGFLAILGGVIYLAIVFCLPETLRCLVGNGEKVQLDGFFVKPRLTQKSLLSEDESKKYPLPPKPSLRGYWNIFKFKPVALCSFNNGLLFAGFYAMSVTFAEVLKDHYHFSSLHVSLSYICPGVSLVSGSLIGGRISDYLRTRMNIRHPGRYIPEHRFTLQFVGLAISLSGLLGYGWCIAKHHHVVSVFVFTFLTGFGMTFVFVTTTTYLTECSPAQKASSVAVANFFRNASAAVSSVIIHILVEKMGWGWCFTGLALLDVLGIAIVFFIIWKGPAWRKEWNDQKQNGLNSSSAPPTTPAPPGDIGPKSQ